VQLITFTKPASYLILCQSAHIPTLLLHCRRITELCAEQHEHISQHNKVQTLSRLMTKLPRYQGASQLQQISLKSGLLAKMKMSAYSSNMGRLIQEHASFFPKMPSCYTFKAKFLGSWNQNKYMYYIAGSAVA